jgi:hypothetical protein
MSDNFKKFVSANRQDFDTGEPDKDLWKKIDAKMNAGTPSRISSKWLSKIIYIGFSASILVIALYFIANSAGQSPANGLASRSGASALAHAKQAPEELNTGETAGNYSDNKKLSQSAQPAFPNKPKSVPSGDNTFAEPKKDTALSSESYADNVVDQKKNESANTATSSGEVTKTNRDSTSEKKPGTLPRKIKKQEIRVPQEPEQMNVYTGTLYEASSLCAVLRTYKFPGKAKGTKVGGLRDIDEGLRTVIRTVSCAQLERMKNVKAVWVNGITDKEFTVSIKRNFKNISLVKPDGRKISPEAISHYYPGLTAISEYKGQNFSMIFYYSVDFILFFKDAEEGDKIVIDGTIEAIIKNRPE